MGKAAGFHSGGCGAGLPAGKGTVLYAPGTGRAASPRQGLHSYVFSWVSECIWLGCTAAAGGLQNKNVHVFFLTAVCSLQRHSAVPGQSSGVASRAAPLMHCLCSAPRPNPDDVCRPRRAALWDAEQLAGLPGTAGAAMGGGHRVVPCVRRAVGGHEL